MAELGDLERVVRDGELWQAYHDGAADGAAQTLFGGPLHEGGELVHRVFGRRVRMSLEWLDEPPPQRLIDGLRERAAERGRRFE